MMVLAERFEDLKDSAQVTNWRGRSGRFYALAPVPLASFSLAGSSLYLLAAEDRVLWVGTAADLVADSASRQRFRAALRLGEAAFSITAPADDVARMTMAWDLEAAVPVKGLRLT